MVRRRGRLSQLGGEKRGYAPAIFIAFTENEVGVGFSEEIFFVKFLSIKLKMQRLLLSKFTKNTGCHKNVLNAADHSSNTVLYCVVLLPLVL